MTKGAFFSNSRLVSLAGHYLRLLALFLLEKPLFMLYARPRESRYSLREWLQVMWHGVGIDLAVAAYLSFIPLLLIIANIWAPRVNLKKLWRIYDMLVAAVLSLIFVSDAALYPYWGFKLDASVFFYLKTPAEAFASVPVWVSLLGFVLVVAVGLLFYLYLVRSIKPVAIPFNRVIMRLPLSLVYFILAFPLTLAARGGLKESTMNVGHAYFSSDLFLNHSAVNPAFSMLSSMSKTHDYSKWYDYFDEESRARYFDGLYSTADGSVRKLLNTDRPNVLLVVMESFGGVFTDKISGHKDITPRLDSLINEGVYFSNCYAGSFRTDRGLVCVVNGHPALPATSIMKLPAKSANLPSVAGSLAGHGYSTYFMYGGDINFTNMNSWLYNSGFSHITADVDFSVSERHTNAWGVNDDITFGRLYNDIIQRTDSLWMTCFLSLSSHEPFDVPYNRLEEKIPNAFAYSDSCLGAFVDSLRNTPVWDNLLMVIIADHGYRYFTEGIAADPYVRHIPALWIGGAVRQPAVIDRIMSQSDMAATILGQMGVDHSDFLFSRNVLSDSYTYPFSFYTFNNGLCFMDSTGVTLYDDDASKCLINDSFGSEERINRGKAILQTLYDDLEDR